MTDCHIHAEWLGHFITRYYHFILIGWNIEIRVNGLWKGERV